MPTVCDLAEATRAKLTLPRRDVHASRLEVQVVITIITFLLTLFRTSLPRNPRKLFLFRWAPRRTKKSES